MHLPTITLTILPLLALTTAYQPQDLYARDSQDLHARAPSPRHQARGIGGSKIIPENAFPPIVPWAAKVPSWNTAPANEQSSGAASSGSGVPGVHLSVVLPTCSGEPQKVNLCTSYCSCFDGQVFCQRNTGPRLGQARAALVMQRERMCKPRCVCEKKKRSLFRGLRGKKAKKAAGSPGSTASAGTSEEGMPPRRG